MLNCWELDPVKRPKFSELVESLSVYLAKASDYVCLDNESLLHSSKPKKDEVIVNDNVEQ